MNKLHVAILTDWYLPGINAGGPVRSIHSLIQLLKEEVKITVITRNTDLGISEPYPGIQPNKWFEKDGVGYYYFANDKLNKENMALLLKQLNVDLIYLNSLWSFPFALQVVQMKNAINKPMLLAPRGMLGTGAMSIKPLKKKLVLKILQWSGALANVNFHATNAQEVLDIQTRFPKARVFNVANVNYSHEVATTRPKQSGKLKLFYLSRVVPVKNLLAALLCLQRVQSSVEVVYDIFGSIEDADYWQKCESIIKELPRHIQVNYKGQLGFNEVQTVISNYHALLLPTSNENFGHSIVESLYSGCPVIISDQTPWHQLQAVGAGFDLPLLDTPAFTRAVEELAQLNQDDFNIRSQAAIKYIRQATDHGQTAAQYKDMFYESAKNKSFGL